MCFQSLPSLDQAPEADPTEEVVGRRSAPRVTVRVPARFQVGEHAVDVLVADISETGARLRVSGPPPRGVEGVLRWEDMECACRVMWSAANEFGVRFGDAAAKPVALIEVAKRKPRKPPLSDFTACLVSAPPTRAPTPRAGLGGRIELPVEVRQGERWIKVRLKAVSRHGFEISWFPRCQHGQPIHLKGPRLPLLQGRVMWSDNLTIGSKLNTPLHDAVLEHVNAQLWGRS